MDRVKINDNALKYPKFDAESFSFSEEDKLSILNELDRLEDRISQKCQATFSISKMNDLFSGSLKIDARNIFAYGKGLSVAALFYKLQRSVEKSILKEEQLY